MDEKLKGKNPPPGQQFPPIFYKFDAISFAKNFKDYNDIKKLSKNMALYLLNTSPSDKEYLFLYNSLLDGGVDYEWSLDDSNQKPNERIRKFLKAVATLSKYQLL